MQYGVQRRGRPGSAARQCRQGPISDGMCPHCGRPDSTGHILGGCKHERMQAMYIKRHNMAVQLVTRWLRKRSAAGGVYTIMDACKGAAAELEKHKVQGTRCETICQETGVRAVLVARLSGTPFEGGEWIVPPGSMELVGPRGP